jgi:hypothetical protein
MTAVVKWACMAKTDSPDKFVRMNGRRDHEQRSPASADIPASNIIALTNA